MTTTGKFTIIDTATVDDIDCSNNFFVTRDHIWQPRASVVCELLCEMNPDVVGASLVHDPLDLVNNKPEYFDQFSLIIAADLPVTAVTALASLCGSKNIPLIVGRAYGLIGYYRHLTPLHYIIEGKPLNSQPDLRLATPFPGLVEYASLFKEDLEGLEDNLHSHVPFVILLLIILQEWKAAHDGKAPSTQAEKDAFRAMIMDRRRDRIEVDEDDPTKFKVFQRSTTFLYQFSTLTFSNTFFLLLPKGA
jgi:amyloid beta precursor protein binding protein 1